MAIEEALQFPGLVKSKNTWKVLPIRPACLERMSVNHHEGGSHLRIGPKKLWP